MTEAGPPTVSGYRSEVSFLAICIGIISSALIASLFVFPWYESNSFVNSGFGHADEYGLLGFSRDGLSHGYNALDSTIGTVGDLMDLVSVLVAIALIMSIVALALTSLERRVSGVVAGTVSAALLMAACAVFYFGILDALRLEEFSGMTHWNRTQAFETGPELGFFISVAAPAVQAAQAIFLAYSGRD